VYATVKRPELLLEYSCERIFNVEPEFVVQVRKELLMILKKVRPVLGYVLAILMIVALGGCATGRGGGADQLAAGTKPVTPLKQTYSNILVCAVQTTPALKKDYEQPLELCQLTLINTLLQKHKYKKVAAAYSDEASGKSTLLVKLNVSDMRIASTTARLWGGAFAGSSYMHIHMQLVNAKTRKVVREKEFDSSNNAFAAAWTGGASDRSLPSDMAKIMAAYIDKAVQAS
jgi:hypothetical protein